MGAPCVISQTSEDRRHTPVEVCSAVGAGKGGKYYGPNKINLWNTAERGTVRRSPWDPAACSRLFDESKRILEECIGRPLPDV